MVTERGTSPIHTVDWALAYGRLGWRVFPVVAREKRPIRGGWQRAATTDPEVIASLWRQTPGANIGLLCGEAIDVFDIEGEHLGAVKTWLNDHALRLPNTPIARSGGGGLHLFVQPLHVGGHNLQLDGVHIGELKARGGFIVACPSRTSGQYAWHRSPFEITLAVAPGWLQALVREPLAAKQRRDHLRPPMPSRAMELMVGLHRVVAEATEGQRNARLFWASCRAAQHGLDQDVASEILVAAAVTAGLPEPEARRTIASGLRR